MLTMGTPSGRGRPASNLAEAFAARVKLLSKGTMSIKIRYDQLGGPSRLTPAHHQFLGRIRNGTIDLATIWAPSLDLAGVKTARPYQVPFLLTSKEQATRVTTGPAAVKAMQGLQAAGLTGLALVPQGFSRIFGYHKPLTSVADLAGASIRTPYGPSAEAGKKCRSPSVVIAAA